MVAVMTSSSRRAIVKISNPSAIAACGYASCTGTSPKLTSLNRHESSAISASRAVMNDENRNETPIANNSANHRAFGGRKPSTRVMRMCEADFSANPSASKLAVANR